VRQSKHWIDALAQGYSRLENLVYAGNDVHVRWIQRVGFELVELLPEFGPYKQPFWRFRRDSTGLRLRELQSSYQNTNGNS
jgi:hypothetical protein